MSLKLDFKKYIAQTSNFAAFQLEVAKAEGIYVYDRYGKDYIDLMSGISVSNIGHRHPKVIAAVKEQLDNYMHVMVYGEFVESPQVKLAVKLAALLPSSLSMTYFVNSGSEAIEGAIKLARKYTQRTEVIAFKGAYHGSTLGALALLSDDQYKQPFLPLMPDVRLLEFNNINQLEQITERTACVVTEVIQAGRGIIAAEPDFMNALRKKCTETGCLLIFDEIQTCYGRTGKLFAFEHYNTPPDILCIAKSMGGEMPLGAFISSNSIMDCLNGEHPLHGHATTFGGHPVSCAASLATLDVILDEKLIEKSDEKQRLFRDYLSNQAAIKEIRGKGMFMAIEFHDATKIEKLVESCINNGIITYWFLFNHNSISLIPPLNITNEEIKLACDRLLKAINLTF
ncbi:MAG: aspartate aminotransferase family protein [Bacteroidetes bacterium]|nr:aspartate aminotransferase family protein [Bacteroidota bacterium]